MRDTPPFLEILCEGESDVPAAEEVLRRRFNLTEQHFRIHPHRGKGELAPASNYFARPGAGKRGLLHQLPIRLKNMARQGVGVVVLVDADRDDCKALKQSLLAVYDALPTKPALCLFRIAVEETESWFLADPDAVRKAFPRADPAKLHTKTPDEVCGAWEKLARAIGRDPAACTGADKTVWAKNIAPHLNLNDPKSPSFSAFVAGIERLLGGRIRAAPARSSARVPQKNLGQSRGRQR